MPLTQLSETRCFNGLQQRFQHSATSTHCDMTFSVYLPPQAESSQVPAILWLSGLTCTDENFVQKAGAQRAAAELGIAIIAPDTSPRGEGVADDPEGAWDFGLGAGFYVDATQAPYRQHYQMYDYISRELISLIEHEFTMIDCSRLSIMGHSMGGHGAITIALKNSDRFQSVSAFAPICSPLHCPWGEKALAGYLGNNPDQWEQYDSCHLIQTRKPEDKCLPLLVDQGSDDNFLVEQLKPERLVEACEQVDYPLQYRQHPGYDHSYFFIASFIAEHIAFHASHLQAKETTDENA